MNKLLSVSLITFTMLWCGVTYAEESNPPQDKGIKNIPVEKKDMKTSEVKVMRTNCYTNVSDCAGLAHWQNDDASRFISCAIYWNNGANGQWNFTLQPGSSHDAHVRYNDTTACVWGNGGVPNGTQRSYIYVR